MGNYNRKKRNSNTPKPPPEPIVFNLEMDKTILDFWAEDAFIRGIRGPVGSGKSSGACLLALQKSLTMPINRRKVRACKGVVIRNTYRELLDTTVSTWLQWFPEEQFGPFLRQDMVHPIKIGDLDLLVLFRALDRPDDIAKLKSLDVTWGWINEASETPLSILEMLETRVGRFPKKASVEGQPFWHGIFMDTNPPPEDHWWYWLAEQVAPMLNGARTRAFASPSLGLEYLRGQMAIKAKESGDFAREWGGFARALEGMITKAGKNEQKAQTSFDRLTTKYAFFAQPSGLSDQAENVDNLPEGYYERLMIGKSAEWINVYVHGNYGIVMDGQIAYPEYNDEVHYDSTLTDAVEGLTILRGFDFGRTPCCIFTQVDPEGRWLVFDEITSKDMDIDEFGDIVTKHSSVHYPRAKFVDFCDPSGFFKGDKSDLTCAQILATKGIDVEGGVQDPTIRFNSVKKALRGMVRGRPEFQIGPKCKVARKGFLGAYCYERVNTSGGERYKEEPTKKHPVSDIHNAIQYVATMLYRSELTETQRSGHNDEEDYYGFQSGFQSAGGGSSVTTGY